MSILTIVGARPNFMKAAPIHEAFRAANIEHHIIHTGQHFDASMSKVFFDNLGMPKPSVYLGVGSGTHAVQTAKVMMGLDEVFEEMKPDMVLVVGDVNSTMAAALVAVKRRIPVGHVEAGLRSRDWDMPEEVNRVVTDSISDLLLTPSPDADANLKAEGVVDARIVRVGNVMIDTLFSHLPKARALPLPPELQLSEGGYGVITMHRPSNVDDQPTFERLLGALTRVAERIPLVFPVHPRTAARIDAFGLADRFPSGIKRIEPLGYLEFMSLVSRAQLVLTDSGGIQEESTALGLPCLTMRESTERPITVDEGTNTIVKTDPERIVSTAFAVLEGGGKSGRVPELWDGQTGPRIVDAVTKFLSDR